LQNELLNFETPSGVMEGSPDLPTSLLISDEMGSGVAVGVTCLFLFLSWTVARRIAGSNGQPSSKPIPNLAPHWHFLSALVSSSLALNLFFGGMTALLLGRTSEEAKGYFADISAFKLSKLSHEHFFGYGISFGLMAALSLFFVSYTKRRVWFPILLLFVFGTLDIASWWLTHFVSFGFHTLSYLTGAIFSLSFVFLYLQLHFTHWKYFTTLFKKGSP
jgi:hypothetical protein